MWIGKLGEKLFLFVPESHHANRLDIHPQSQDSCDPPIAGTTVAALEVSAFVCCDLMRCVAVIMCVRAGLVLRLI